MRHLINPQKILWHDRQVQTPLGKGRSLGIMVIKDRTQTEVTQGVLVRLPLDEITRAHLLRPNCITPRPNRSVLFVFGAHEISLI